MFSAFIRLLAGSSARGAPALRLVVIICAVVALQKVTDGLSLAIFAKHGYAFHKQFKPCVGLRLCYFTKYG
jgi:hypothetical protein